MTENEKEVRRAVRRAMRYTQLEWFTCDEITLEILYDDQLWEKAKGQTPTNWLDVLDRKFEELKKLEGVEREEALKEFKKYWAKRLHKRGRLA